jgi:hypothetical protein
MNHLFITRDPSQSEKHQAHATTGCVVSHLAQTREKTINAPVVKHWPYQIDWDLMRRFDERHGDYHLPEDASLAIMQSMLAIAQLRTHDPVVIQRMIGYPLRFISSLVWILLQNERWMFGGGYLELSYLAAMGASEEKVLDSRLYSFLEGVCSDDCQTIINLQIEWERCTGVPIGF